MFKCELNISLPPHPHSATPIMTLDTLDPSHCHTPTFHLPPSSWSSAQQHQTPLGACWECRISGPPPDLLGHNLPFTRRPGIDGQALEKLQHGLHRDLCLIQPLLGLHSISAHL